MASRNAEVYDFVAAPLIGSGGCVSGSVKSANKCDFMVHPQQIITL